jgi:exonuclease VII large subunit
MIQLDKLSQYVTHLTRSLSQYVTYLTRSLSQYVTYLTRSLSQYVTHLTKSLSQYVTHLTRSLSQYVTHLTRSFSFHRERRRTNSVWMMMKMTWPILANRCPPLRSLRSPSSVMMTRKRVGGLTVSVKGLEQLESQITPRPVPTDSGRIDGEC